MQQQFFKIKDILLIIKKLHYFILDPRATYVKNKKFNYLGVIQPGKYGTINGKLTDINNEQWENTSAGNLVFSIELVISNKR